MRIPQSPKNDTLAFNSLIKNLPLDLIKKKQNMLLYKILRSSVNLLKQK